MVWKCHIGRLWSCTGGMGKSRIAHDQGEMEDSARTTVNQQQRTHEKSRYIPHTVLKCFDPPGSMHSRRHDSTTDDRITQQQLPMELKTAKARTCIGKRPMIFVWYHHADIHRANWHPDCANRAVLPHSGCRGSAWNSPLFSSAIHFGTLFHHRHQRARGVLFERAVNAGLPLRRDPTSMRGERGACRR